MGVKKTRYEGRQRRREAAGERFIRGDGFSRSPETERAKEKEGVREGWEEKRGAGGAELTHPLFADCCSLMDPSSLQSEGGKEKGGGVGTRPRHLAALFSDVNSSNSVAQNH